MEAPPRWNYDEAMRHAGAVLVLVGVVGYFYCSSKVSGAPPYRQDAGILETLREPGARWDLARYASAFVGATGSVLLLFTRRR
jgi:hypothetical protein